MKRWIWTKRNHWKAQAFNKIRQHTRKKKDSNRFNKNTQKNPQTAKKFRHACCYRIFQTSFDKGFGKVSVTVWIWIHSVLKSLHFWKSWHAWTAVGGHAFTGCVAKRQTKIFQKQGRNSKAKFRKRKKNRLKTERWRQFSKCFIFRVSTKNYT